MLDTSLQLWHTDTIWYHHSQCAMFQSKSAHHHCTSIDLYIDDIYSTWVYSKTMDLEELCFIQSVWKAKLRELQQANAELADLEEDNFMRRVGCFAIVFLGEIKWCVFACEYTFAFLAFAFGIEVTCGFEKPNGLHFSKTWLMSHILSIMDDDLIMFRKSQGMDCKHLRRFWFILQLMDYLTSRWDHWNVTELNENGCELDIGCLS